MKISGVNEAFIHYLWKYKLITGALYTTDGELVEIISPGIHNHNSGPDFSDARLRIGDTLWAGNVEIHINASDWYKHNHQHDAAYENVILHVVYTNDAAPGQSMPPTTEILGCFDASLFTRYRDFIGSANWVPCFRLIGSVPDTDKALWLERMLIERLEYKSDAITGYLNYTENDWEASFYIALARSFGFGLNALPFEMLARSLPLKIIGRHFDQPAQVEALLFGQAGLLHQGLDEPWPQYLFGEYKFLRSKYSLVPMHSHLWKFMRIRPVNFPTLRIAQFAALIASQQGMLAKVVSCRSVDEIKSLLQVTASAYWETHFHFNSVVEKRSRKLGNDAVHLILINAVLPFLFVYGRMLANDEICNRALAFYTQLPGEKNRIISKWSEAGMNVSDAFNTQALIGLKTSYCDQLRCLDCRIGTMLLRSNGV